MRGSPRHAESEDPSVELFNAVTMAWVAWFGALLTRDPGLRLGCGVFWGVSTAYHVVNWWTASYHPTLHRLDLMAQFACVIACISASPYVPRAEKVGAWALTYPHLVVGLLTVQKRMHVSAMATVFHAPAIALMLVYGVHDATKLTLMALSLSAVVLCKACVGWCPWLWPASRVPSALYAYLLWHALGVTY